ncbi:XRE family transcriptional regulator [Acinetobacter radioresistens]|uniref:XRE family transcriptional regulator n=1 Tax=Acinetobacter radioresistens TaxID=40216 RepID=UPI001C07C354|nr:XRE family transcriptional regulator [Acinetobacter radioresistens]
MFNMNNVLEFLGKNIRFFREKVNFTQKELADRAGISRRTIIALEADQVNISLAKLDAIANALNVSFSTLVSPLYAEEEYSYTNILAWRGSHEDSHATLVGTIENITQTEMWLWSLAAGDSYIAEPDAEGWKEMLYIVEGELTIKIEDQLKLLNCGSSFIFSSSTSYSYHNKGNTKVKFIRNVVH